MTILVTGAAGFIGFHLSKALLQQSKAVLGIDNINAYYTPALKRARLEQLLPDQQFSFLELDIADTQAIDAAVARVKPEMIIHLAAQAGVRHSLKAPFSYTDANITGMLSILEAARNYDVKHMVYASSSSIYGRNTFVPFKEDIQANKPASLYGATKRANELMASSYAHLYDIPLTGLRFFTVYGPWGRPDMAYWMFTEKILNDETINIFNHGNMARDFTYIDDIVDGIIAAANTPPGPDTDFHEIYNLGNDHPEKLMTMVSHLEALIGKPALKNMMEMQPGDVEKTWADISKARNKLGYKPKISLSDGLEHFINWRQSLPSGF